MKKIYKKPSAEMVNVKLLGSVLDAPNPQPGDWSNYTMDGDAKEQEFEWDEDATSNHLRNINLWDE